MPRTSRKRQLIEKYWKNVRERFRKQGQAMLVEVVEESLEQVEEVANDSVNELVEEVISIGEIIMEGLNEGDELLLSESSESDGLSLEDETSSSDSSALNSSSDSESSEDSHEEDEEDMMIEQPELDDLEDDIGDLEDLEVERAQALVIQWLMTHRYLEVRQNLPKTKEFSLRILSSLDENRFRQFCRVSPEGFQHIVVQIEDHLIFKSNGNCRQAKQQFF